MARKAVADFARQVRDARLAAGVSQDVVAHAAGTARSTLSRLERGLTLEVTIVTAATIASALGLELSLRLYPAGPSLRDAGHVRLLARFRELVSPRFAWAYERRASLTGDPRAFDAVLRVGALRIGIEAETRLYDLQALQRRIAAKLRDSNVDRIILVIADTRHNRAVLKMAGASISTMFPCPRRTVLVSLRAGIDPGADGLLLI